MASGDVPQDEKNTDLTRCQHGSVLPAPIPPLGCLFSFFLFTDLTMSQNVRSGSPRAGPSPEGSPHATRQPTAHRAGGGVPVGSASGGLHRANPLPGRRVGSEGRSDKGGSSWREGSRGVGRALREGSQKDKENEVAAYVTAPQEGSEGSEGSEGWRAGGLH